jgi:hypothetical protein
MLATGRGSSAIETEEPDHSTKKYFPSIHSKSRN